MGKLRVCLLLALVFAGTLYSRPNPTARAAHPSDRDETQPFVPPGYVVYRAVARPEVDGKLTDAAWRAAPWTDLFVDIVGDTRPRPRFPTRAKMLWDDEYFYVAAELEEPDVWATQTRRDASIFQDNAFEIFIDPDGDTHNYYELQVNAFGALWDLMLVAPYRDGGPAISAWDVAGLEVGVHIDGTINQPGDRDNRWTVEVALPWKILREAAPRRRLPQPGDQWRVNLSRVQWQLEVRDGRYVKRTDPKTGNPLPEDYWVWSPQGAVNLHMPERWGYVQFSGITAGQGTEAFVEDPNERIKWALRQLYYRQRDFREANGRYAADLEALNASDVHVEGLDFRPSLQVTQSLYEITAPGFGGKLLHIRQDGKVWAD
jgi:hypothetical protein